MKNINKQEELVSALWDFAEGLQRSRAEYPQAVIKQDGFKVKMDMDVMGKTLKRIAKNFNLEIQPIQ